MRIIPLDLWNSGAKSPLEKEEDDHNNFRRSWYELITCFHESRSFSFFSIKGYSYKKMFLKPVMVKTSVVIFKDVIKTCR